jgi:hypothetical protein
VIALGRRRLNACVTAMKPPSAATITPVTLLLLSLEGAKLAKIWST